MRAITVYQPWAYAIAHLGKGYENRTWPPPAAAVGRPLAIHAGRTFDERGARFIEELGLALPPRSEMPTGALVAVCRLAGVVMPADPQSDDPWFRGPFGWRLDERRPLARPVPIVGKQGLWEAPDHLLASWRDVAAGTCAECGEPLETEVYRCSSCGRKVCGLACRDAHGGRRRPVAGGRHDARPHVVCVPPEL